MKYKKIYYPLLFLILFFVIIFSATDIMISLNNKNDLINENYNNDLKQLCNIQNSSDIANFIENKLNQMKISKTTATNTDDIWYAQTQDKVTYINPDVTVGDISNNKCNGRFNYINTSVHNIIVYFKGSDSNNTILFSTSYDKYYNLPSASRYSNVIAMLKVINNLKNNLNNKNNLLFVFTDKSFFDNIGAYTLMQQYNIFNSSIKNLKACVSFESYGNKSGLALLNTKIKDKSISKALLSLNKYVYDNSAINYKLKSDYNAYNNIDNVIRIASIRGRDNYNSFNDSFEKLSKTLMYQQLNLISNIVSKFGEVNINNDQDNLGGYFSFFNIFSIYYSKLCAYIFLSLIVIILILSIIIIASKNIKNLLSLFKGVITQILTLASIIVSGYLIYYVFGLFLSWFGVVNFESLSTLMYSSVPLFIGSLFLGVALYCGFNTMYKQKLKTKAIDVIRGSIFINSIISIFLIIFSIQLSYIISIFTFLQLIVFLVSYVLKNKFKNKFHFDIERMFFYVIPIIICAPIFISNLFVYSLVVSTVFYPLLITITLMYLPGLLAYFSYLRPSMNIAYAKLPPKRVRYIEEVEENVEDKAKKGKYTLQKVRKTYVKKEDRVYSNSKGVAIITIISLLIIIFSTGQTSLGINLNSDDSILIPKINYVISKTDSSKTFQWQLEDGITYKKFNKVVKGFNYEDGLYVKTDNDSSFQKDQFGNLNSANITKNESDYTVKVDISKNSLLEFKFNNTQNISSIEFNFGNNNYTYVNPAKDNINFLYNYEKNEVLKFKINGSTTNLTLDYTQIYTDYDYDYFQYSKVFNNLINSYSILKNNLITNIYIKYTMIFTT